MKKRILVILLISVAAISITGCDELLEESGVTLESETLGTIGKDAEIETQEKEMVDLKTTCNIEFNGQTLIFNPVYSIEKERAENWMFTQSSAIDLTLGIESVPEGLNVVVSQLYADISLLSKYAKYNGIRQDSLNIEYKTLPNGGISIRNSDPYIMPFQVEAVDKSETFFYMYNGYGSSTTYRVTEKDLSKEVQGAVLNVVWTILITEDSTGNQYVKTIDHKIGIPYDRVAEFETETTE